MSDDDDLRSVAQGIHDGLDPDDPAGSRRTEVKDGRSWVVIRSPKIAGQPRAEFWLPEKDPPPE